MEAVGVTISIISIFVAVIMEVASSNLEDSLFAIIYTCADSIEDSNWPAAALVRIVPGIIGFFSSLAFLTEVAFKVQGR